MEVKCNRGIYAIENCDSSKYYIGSSKVLSRRRIQHFSDLVNNRHHCAPLQADFNRNVPDVFRFSVLEYMPKSTACDLLRREQEWLDVFFAEGACYNIRGSTRGPVTYKHTVTTRIKMRMRMLSNNPMSDPKNRQKISEALSHFSEEESQIVCEEFLNSSKTLLKLAEELGAGRTSVRRAVSKHINKYINGPLTADIHKWKLTDKRNFYRLPYYRKLCDKYLDGTLGAKKFAKSHGMSECYFRTVLGWFLDGKDLYALAPDKNMQQRYNLKKKTTVTN